LTLLDPDPDPYIVKLLDPDPYIEYTDPKHCSYKLLFVIRVGTKF